MSAAIDDRKWQLPPGLGSERGSLTGAVRLTVASSGSDVRMSLGEYLAREETSEHKHEYVGGRVLAMAGASDAHVSITQALTAALLPLAHARGCRVFSADMKLQIDDLPGTGSDRISACYYPDLMVTCSEADGRRKSIKREPTVLVEVLSPSTSKTDRGRKWSHYQTIASLRQYWLVSQDEMRVEVRERRDDHWEVRTYSTPDAVLPIAGVDAGLRVADIYAYVRFDMAETEVD